MTDCVHHVALCPTCGGLEATTLTRLTGVTGISLTLADGTTQALPGAALYVGPSPAPCDRTEV